MRWIARTLLVVTLAAIVPPPQAAAQSDERLERIARRIERSVDRIVAVSVRLAERAKDRVDREYRNRVVWTQESDDFRWTGRLARGQILEIKGVNGDVFVERAAGDEIEVRATLQGRRDDPRDVRIERVEHEEGLTFCAVYPTPRGKRENYCGAGSDGRMSVERNDVEVRFEVTLPAGVDFAGKTVNGDVEAEDLGSDLALQTVNGDVVLSTTGFAEATTVNGSIDAVMGAAELADGLKFTTVNGSITLDVDDDVSADIEAKWVNGSLDTDLPFRVHGRMSRTSARGSLGEGGPLLSLSTVNGSIRLR